MRQSVPCCKIILAAGIPHTPVLSWPAAISQPCSAAPRCLPHTLSVPVRAPPLPAAQKQTLCGAPIRLLACYSYSIHLHRPLPSIGLAQKRHLQLNIHQLKGCVLAHGRRKHPAPMVEGLEKDRVACTGEPKLAHCRRNLCTRSALAGWHPGGPFAGITQNRQVSWAGGAQSSHKAMPPPELLADARP